VYSRKSALFKQVARNRGGYVTAKRLRVASLRNHLPALDKDIRLRTEDEKKFRLEDLEERKCAVSYREFVPYQHADK